MDTADDLPLDYSPELPIVISCVAERYLIFDVKLATWLRRQLHICGLTIGSLPLAPSQNLFLGIPIEIMPEEAMLLVERGLGTVQDEVRAHDQAIHSPDPARRADYLAMLQNTTRHIEALKVQEKAESKKRALEKQSRKAAVAASAPKPNPSNAGLLDFDDSEDPPAQQTPHIDNNSADLERPSNNSTATSNPSNSYGITPATSDTLLAPHSPSTTSQTVKNVPPSYPLFRLLHDKGYFMTPGLRFGCQYAVYPGDPLRFHSHFLAVGRQWNEEIDLMDIVGGGRLGTGVKKAFLVGAEAPNGEVRTFSVEWAAM